MASLPQLTVTTDAPLDLEVDALVVPVFRGGFEAPGTETVLRELGLTDVPRDANFRGKVGELLHLAAPGLAAGQVTLVGLGRLDELEPERVRRAAGAAVRALAPRCATVATTLPLVDASSRATLGAAAEGALLGAYRYDEQRSRPDPLKLGEVRLVIASSLHDHADAVLARARLHAQAQCVARELVTAPPNLMAPADVARTVQDLVPDGVEVEVWDEQRLADEGCGGLVAVGQGSSRPPRLVQLRYQPSDPVARVALVGKGITFDTGGISLKRPSKIMENMKGDMAGASVVAAVMTVVSELRLPVEVMGYLALAENMPGDNAQRPSDVITIRGGTTVEVMNTDAEGRLVLADALRLASEQEPDAIVDIATLTGAIMRAIGKRAMGLFGNDDDLIRQLLLAAEDAGEAMWHMPMWEDLRDNLDSEVADLENMGEGDEAGATMGALFLREFVDGTPWVHLDIAGPFWQDMDRWHLPRHGTGVGVRTLLRWLEQTID